jgi:hypothetical protein
MCWSTLVRNDDSPGLGHELEGIWGSSGGKVVRATSVIAGSRLERVHRAIAIVEGSGTGAAARALRVLSYGSHFHGEHSNLFLATALTSVRATQAERWNGEEEFRGRSVADENRPAWSGKNHIPPAGRVPVPRPQFAP